MTSNIGLAFLVVSITLCSQCVPAAIAGTDPSYYQSGVCQNIPEKEHRFRLYMNQRRQGTPGANEKFVVTPDQTVGLYGTIVVDDFTIRDGPADNANLVARARGMHVADGRDEWNWLFCHSIMFTDSRFKGSSLKMLGDFHDEADGEWAIVGGTGQFAYARGVVTAKVIQPFTPPTGRTWELSIRAFALCISEMTKIGPWGGQGGTDCDIKSPPRSLQTVTIGYEDVIKSVAFSYTDEAGEKNAAGPWGGDSKLSVMITFAPSEVIKQVHGTTGTIGGDTVVTSLTLVSNLKIYGPFGKKSDGATFSSEVPDDRAIVGFFARAAASVHALGAYCA
ncbi:hypothetical protein U9M48_000940 [Paspalum notatum var. saurae]|uniref:Dirigent protein n=1 Tax=Paspalum notatum var. saurae TaxID=547442 RepID=A0AAQ3SCM9_PASNO